MSNIVNSDDKRLLFFCKSTCKNNRKQKDILNKAGIGYQEEDLLKYPWTPEYLMLFMQYYPRENWCNASAPDIKNGVIEPNTLPQDELLHKMCQSPVLIRRPLMQVGDKRWVGFDWNGLLKELDVDDQEIVDLVIGDVETCLRR